MDATAIDGIQNFPIGESRSRKFADCEFEPRWLRTCGQGHTNSPEASSEKWGLEPKWLRTGAPGLFFLAHPTKDIVDFAGECSHLNRLPCTDEFCARKGLTPDPRTKFSMHTHGPPDSRRPALGVPAKPKRHTPSEVAPRPKAQGDPDAYVHRGQTGGTTPYFACRPKVPKMCKV